MIKYLGFNKTLGIGRLFGFITTPSDSGNSGGEASTIIYLSFPLTRTSEGRDVSALPLTMDRINPNYATEQVV